LEVRELMDLREVAEYLGCGRSQSYKIIRPGPQALPAYRCGRKILVKRGELEDWLEKNRYRPNENTPDEQER
jgi:excisionase family DNA binding protein